MKRLIVEISVVLLATGPVVGLAAFAAPERGGGKVQVHLSITGGFHYRGTLMHAESPLTGYLCQVTKQASLVLYEVIFDGPALFDVSSGKDKQSKRNFFSLTIHHFKPQIARYTGPDQDLVLAVQGRAYHNISQPGIHSTFVATIASGGRSGSFNAGHVSPYFGYPGGSVTIHGSWSCPTLHR